MQFAFGAIVEQVVGLSPEAPLIRRLLEHYSTFMKGLVSVPLNIPGTPYARAVEVRNYSISVVKYLRRLIFFCYCSGMQFCHCSDIIFFNCSFELFF
jgi:hypothetical protein